MPPSSVTERAMTCGETARARWKVPDSVPLAVWRIAFVLSSLYEGFPNVLVEAMCCGVPVIATDCVSGPSEILGPSEHGILVPDPLRAPETEAALADAIVRLAGSDLDRARYADRAARRAGDFDASTIIEQWIREC